MKTVLLAAALVLTMATGTAHAMLVSMNDVVYGPGSITHDANTQLDWLDLTKSTGLSVNDILGGAGGFLANGFALATLGQVETMYTDGGWDGVDDSATAGSAGHLPFVLSMHALFGVTAGNAPGFFNEGWALSTIPGLVSRPFNEITQGGIAGRDACTTVGFDTFTNVNVFSGCRMDYDQRYDAIGAYLVRPAAAPVPEPASLLLLGTGLIGAGARRWRNRRKAA